MQLLPARGGFAGRIGVAWFIRELLAGRNPLGAEEAIGRVDPQAGLPQADMQTAYKHAMRLVAAENAVGAETERRARRGLPPLTDEEMASLIERFMRRPRGGRRGMTYSSFRAYFRKLMGLGWVEATGETEPSAAQVRMGPQGGLRSYYRLTASGQRATLAQLSDPIATLYRYETSRRHGRPVALEK